MKISRESRVKGNQFTKIIKVHFAIFRLRKTRALLLFLYRLIIELYMCIFDRYYGF